MFAAFYFFGGSGGVLGHDDAGTVATLGRRPHETATFAAVVVDLRDLARRIQQARRQLLTTRTGHGRHGGGIVDGTNVRGCAACTVSVAFSTVHRLFIIR